MKHAQKSLTMMIVGILMLVLCVPAMAQARRSYVRGGTLEAIDFDERTITFVGPRGMTIEARLHPRAERLVFVDKVGVEEFQPGEMAEVVLSKPMSNEDTEVQRMKELSTDYNNRPRARGRLVVGQIVSIGDVLVMDVDGETFELAMPADPNTVMGFKETTASRDDLTPDTAIVVRGVMTENGPVLPEIRIMRDGAEDDEDLDLEEGEE